MLPVISFAADYRALDRSLDNLGRKQLPFAMASALTATVKAVQAHVTAELPTIFDRPTPFTMRSVGVTPATKATLTARVFIKDLQAQYLALEETGGARGPKRTALVMPRAIRLNAYGNIPRTGVRSAKARKDVFVGTIKGIGGIWQRPKRGKGATGWPSPILLVRFTSSARYKPRFGFKDRVTRAARVGFAATMPTAFAEAMRTARR